MALTQRFGFTHFGLDAEGSLFDEGGKFTGRDRRVLDRILAAFEAHDHIGGVRLDDPSSDPVLELLPEAGELDAGTTYHYRVSYLDRYGLETAASGEVSVTTPDSVQPPAPPRVEAQENSEDGLLDEGLHWYGLTVLDASGNETTMSAPSAINLTDWRKVEISAPDGLPVGAVEVAVWRQGPLDSGFTRLVTLDATGVLVPLFVDDGSIPSEPCPCDPEQSPPTENMTSATNAVRVTIPFDDVGPGTLVRRWRLYRSEESGNFPADALVAEVVETVIEEGEERLVTEFVDDGGTTLLAGVPLEASQTLMPSRRVGGSGGSGSGVGHLYMTGPQNAAGERRIFALLSTVRGELETRSIGLTTEFAMGDLLLSDVNGGFWRVVLEEDGSLVTESAVGESEGDRAFPFDAGPDLVTPDASVTWRLAVNASGELITEGDPIPGTDLAYLRPVADEPLPPETGGVLYHHNGRLCFKDSNNLVTVLADGGS